jgi:hypothetical protein
MSQESHCILSLDKHLFCQLLPLKEFGRYLDFTKFEDLLNSLSLYFTAIDRFEDPFEGSLPKLVIQDMNSAFKNNPEMDEKEEKENEKKFGKDSSIEKPGSPLKDYFIGVKKMYAVNCHINNVESAAMWKLYLKSNEGIAIQSKIGNLYSVLDKSDIGIYLSEVKYIDYERETFNWHDAETPLIYKRKSFEHERELRGIIRPSSVNGVNEAIQNGGIKIRIDLKELIENIYVSPSSPPWLSNLVNDTSKKFGYDFKIINSKLDESPLY